jgi:hypothetical protein
MFPLPRRRVAAAPALVLVVVAVLASCTGASSSPATSPAASPAASPATTAAASGNPSPGPTAGAACATAPTPGSLPGWQVASGDPTVFPTLVSSQQVCGTNRFLFGFISAADNRPAASPDRTASVAFYNLARDADTPVTTVEARFQWLLEGVTGIYVADVDYDEAGEWGAEFTTAAPGGPPETIRARFEVQPDGLTPGIGDRAPSVKTLTLDDVGGDVAKISSDSEPDPALYEVSIDEALAEHRSFVVAFATPAFCRSQTCGPMLDVVKGVAGEEPGVAFINVEPYQLAYTDGRLQPVLDANNQLQLVDASRVWGLPSEPWVFVVDADGIVRGSFEATVSPEDLKKAIDASG